MEYIQAAPRLLFTEQCLQEYFTKFNFLHGTYIQSPSPRTKQNYEQFKRTTELVQKQIDLFQSGFRWRDI